MPEPLREQLQSFFTAYARAGDENDFERIAASYASTYVESAPTSVVAWTVDDAYRAALRDRADAMGDVGLTSSEATVEQVTELAPDHVTVRVGWALTFDRTPAPITSRFAITYVVRVVDEPRILLYVSHEDQAAVMQRDGILPADPS